MRTEDRRNSIEAAIFWLSEDYRFRRAMRAHYADANDQCAQRCGKWPCLTFTMANSARNLHEDRIRAAERLADYPTQPMRAVTDSGRHHAPREATA